MTTHIAGPLRSTAHCPLTTCIVRCIPCIDIAKPGTSCGHLFDLLLEYQYPSQGVFMDVAVCTVIEDGQQFACEREMVTFTCHVIRSASLQWYSPLIRQIVYNIRTTDPVVSMPSFTANLTSIGRSGIFSNFTSTLQVTASRRFARSDTTVECRNQPGVNMSSRFTVAGNSDYIVKHFNYIYSKTIYCKTPRSLHID